MKPSRSAAELDPTEEWEAMLPELKATLQQLLTLPQEGEGMSEGVAETETPEEVMPAVLGCGGAVWNGCL